MSKSFYLLKFEDGVFIQDPFQYHLIAVITVILYLLVVKFLPTIVKKMYPDEDEKEKAAKYRPIDFVMFFHNAFLSVFAFFNLTFGGYSFFKNFVFGKRYFDYMCDTEGVFQNTPSLSAFCATLHVWSKFLELFDTVFIIIKNPKKKVNFIQYYHHITVLLFAYYGAVIQCTFGVLLILINSFIHTFMYYYYAKAVFFTKPKWGVLLTGAQIVQMFVCTFWCLSFGYYYILKEENCSYSPKYFNGNGATVFILYSYFMYGSYIYLFVSFFLGRYVFRKKKTK